MKYGATLIAEFEIEAENIAHARKVAKAIRSIGERGGASRGQHDRDSVPHVIRLTSEGLEVRR